MSATEPIGMAVNVSWQDTVGCTVWIQRVLCVLLRIKMAGDWESMGNWLTLVDLENGC